MFPTIPEDLNGLEVGALTTLAKEIKAAAVKALAEVTTAEGLAEVHAALAKRDEIVKLASAKKAAADLVTSLEAEQEEVEEAETPPAEAADAPAESETVEEVSAEAAATPAKVRTSFGSTAVATVAAPPAKGRKIGFDHLVSAGDTSGRSKGTPFESWAEVAQAAIDMNSKIRPNSNEDFAVARLFAEYPEDRRLTEDFNWNMSRFEHDEVMAALCAPATPYYDLACANTLRRPVFNSLPQFQAPRGKVSIMSSPSLSDITTGVGVWSAANEASSNATKLACQTITCNSPTEFQIYGVYRCLTVRNLLAMTYPELVEAWLNRLGAAHARLAEIQLLNAMGTGATSITTPALGYGAATTITTTILNYLALYQETQRWDISGNMEAWIPRWVQDGIKIDLMRRRTTNGEVQRVPSDEQVNALFRDVGVNPHWFIDTPSWATSIPSVATGGVLSRLPANVQILIAPPGKFAVMDRGELTIGVTGNNIYRDNNSNNRNEFTFFFENFEGVVNTDSCPAHILDFGVCWNGTQADDVVMNCQGGDEPGYQS